MITIFYGSRVGKTTTEVAFEYPSLVLELNIRDLKLQGLQTTGQNGPLFVPAQQRQIRFMAFLQSLHALFTPSAVCCLKRDVYREQCVTNVGILHKPADSVPFSMQEAT